MTLADIWGATDKPVPVDRSVAIKAVMRYINDWVNETTLPTDRQIYRLGLTVGEFEAIRNYDWASYDRNVTMRGVLLHAVQIAANGYCTAPMRAARTPTESMAMMNEGLDMIERGLE